MDAEERAAATIGSVAFAALLWLLALVILAGAVGFGYPANVAPLVLGGMAAILMTALLVVEVVGLLRPNREPRTRDASRDASERAALGWVAASMVSVTLLGFVAGSSIAMVGLLRGYARERWFPTIATTAGVMVVLYVAFGILLNVAFYPGLLGLWG